MQHRSEPRTGRHFEDQMADSGFLESAEVGSHRLLGPSCPEDPGRAGTRDSWPLAETQSIRGPETRLDRSELLCNKVLLKYKGDRESF